MMNDLMVWAGALLLALAGVAGAYFKGRSGGKADERQATENRLNKQSAQAREKVRHVEETTDSMDDAAVRAAASEWVRDETPGKNRD